MVQNPLYDGSASRFEGDRALLLRSIPENARILRAVATLTPVDSTAGGDPFAEIIAFSGASGDLGATKTQAASAAQSWVEVDFHARRTLAEVQGSNFDPKAALQVDIGAGVYVAINEAGAFLGPAPSDKPLLIAASPAHLPSLAVTRFKITQPVATAPDITRVKVRGVPANVSLKLGNAAAFWFHAGEMSGPQTTPDFAAILQAALTRFKVENGYYAIELVLHSDTLARFQIAFEIDVVNQQSAIPAGLKDVVQAFDHSGSTQPPSDVLQVALPAGVTIVADATSARVKGAFDETRIVYGPAGAVTPAGVARLSPNIALAQPVSFASATGATAVDVLIDLADRGASLRLDIRADLDGKPADESLLPSPAQSSVDRPAARKPLWISIPLAAEFQFQARRYWIVLQSLDGDAQWNATATPSGGPPMQRSEDGLSWRDAIDTSKALPLSGILRLRRKPENFQLPIDLQVGKDAQAVRVKLDRFAPLGRVDLSPGAELAQGVQTFLNNAAAGSPGACPEGEHLANGAFDQWTTSGDAIGTPGHIALPNGVEARQLLFASDGSLAYLAVSIGTQTFLQAIDVLCDRLAFAISIAPGPPGPFALHPGGGRAYASISGQTTLRVVDLNARTVLGAAVEIGGSVNLMAISADGASLYLVRTNNAGPEEFVVVDIAALEQSAQSGQALPASALDVTGSAAQTTLALAAAGPAVYALRSGVGGGNGSIVDALSNAAPIPLAGAPAAFALTSDGTRAVVILANQLVMIDLPSGAAIGSPVTLPASAVSVGLSPDGARAFVGHANGTLDVVTLARGLIASSLAALLPPEPVTFLTPRGDRVYMAGAAALAFLPIGIRQPAEWTVTSGAVALICTPEGPAMMLGQSTSFSTASSLVPAPPPPVTAVSQVVPASGACAYELSFTAAADQEGAVAEVLWSGPACAVLPASEPVPIAAVPLNTRFRPVRQRALLKAPAGATQAEVRFQVPGGQSAVVSSASLSSAPGALLNGNLKTLEAGQPTGWTLQAGQASALTFADQGAFVEVRNGSSATADLFQKVAAKPGQHFTLEAQVTASQAGPAQNARLEIRWFDAANAPVLPSPGIDITPQNFDASAAQGVVPASATQAELHLLASRGAVLQVSGVSLRFSDLVSVPIGFVAQSPGSLSVSTMSVAFERAPAPPPSIPAGGLCPATPAGQPAGSGDSCFCCCCGKPRRMSNPAPAKTAAGRPVTTGACVDCGTQLVRPGGRLVPGVAALAAPLLAMAHAFDRPPVTAAEIFRPAVLTRVTGIGPARARQLQAAGIQTLQQLAAAKPEAIAEILQGPGMSPEVATDFIVQARTLSGAPQ